MKYRFMKLRCNVISVLTLLIGIISGISGCTGGNGGGTAPPPQTVTVSVSAPSGNVLLGNSLQFTAKRDGVF